MSTMLARARARAAATVTAAAPTACRPDRPVDGAELQRRGARNKRAVARHHGDVAVAASQRVRHADTLAATPARTRRARRSAASRLCHDVSMNKDRATQPSPARRSHRSKPSDASVVSRLPTTSSSSSMSSLLQQLRRATLRRRRRLPPSTSTSTSRPRRRRRRRRLAAAVPDRRCWRSSAKASCASLNTQRSSTPLRLVTRRALAFVDRAAGDSAARARAAPAAGAAAAVAGGAAAATMRAAALRGGR